MYSLTETLMREWEYQRGERVQALIDKANKLLARPALDPDYLEFSPGSPYWENLLPLISRHGTPDRVVLRPYPSKFETAWRIETSMPRGGGWEWYVDAADIRVVFK